MGTMIQRYRADETRPGDRLVDHPVDLRGNNDPVVLTRPDVVREITRRTSGRLRPDRNEHVRRDVDRAGRLPTRAPRVRDERGGASIARAACDRYSSAGKPRFVAAPSGPREDRDRSRPTMNDPGARTSRSTSWSRSYGEQARGRLDGGADCC